MELQIQNTSLIENPKSNKILLYNTRVRLSIKEEMSFDEHTTEIGICA